MPFPSLWSTFPERTIENIYDEYDYIILGGGTAGCVLANRLSSHGRSVLLVERGSVGDNWVSRVPLFSQPFKSDDSRTVSIQTVPQKFVDGRKFDLLGGNSLGGGSKINAMLYTRGIPAEYNAWKLAGRQGWSYEDMKPFFLRSETHLDKRPKKDGESHGLRGEWFSRSHSEPTWGHTPFITQAAANLGVPYVEDLNSPRQPAQGCAKLHYSIDARSHRSSTLSAFLPYNLVHERAENLHVCTQTSVERINFDIHASPVPRAEGVTLRSQDRIRRIKVRREIVVSAGSLCSPQILLLSGVGPKEHLDKIGIPIIKELPGVGSHLQDHVAVPLQFRVPMRDSVVKLTLRPWTIIIEIILYLLFGIGLLLGQTLELSLFIQSRLFDSKGDPLHSVPRDRDAADPKNLPDIEIMPIAYGEPKECQAHGKGGLAFFIVNLRPTSKGTVRLSSSDPSEHPVVDLNFFATEEDWAIIRKGLAIGMRLQREVASLGYPISEQHVPGSDSNNDIDRFIRQYCRTTTHYSSTCRMAPEIEGGVVDDRLRVYGVQGLRVADTSVFPEIPSTHLAAPAVAVAEKCSSMIQEEYGEA